MKKLNLFGCILFTVFSLPYALAQNKISDLPHGFTSDITQSTVELTAPDIEQLRYEDEERKTKNEEDTPYSVGYPISADINLLELGSYNTVNEYDIWSIRIAVPHALALIPYFKNLEIPRGGKVYIYTDNGRQIVGPIDHSKNSSGKKYPAGLIQAQHFTIEYSQPKSLKETPTLVLNKVGFIYDNYRSSSNDIPKGKSQGFLDSYHCNVNVRCPQGFIWCDQIRSVAMIYMLDEDNNRIDICSGSLVTNDKRDYRPYFLTAAHCINDGDEDFSDDEKSKVEEWLFAFNYQSPDCNNPSAGQEPPLVQTISGSEFVAANVCFADFLLVELNERPPGDFNAYYNGWDNDNYGLFERNPSIGCFIHHPAGDIKKITFFDGQTIDKREADCVDVWRVKIDEGGAEPGSSGGPLFQADGKLIGQCKSPAPSVSGNVACPGEKVDFGRFYRSWDVGSANDEKLEPWLNPTGSIQAMSGDEPCRISYSFSNASDLHTSANVGIYNPSQPRTYNGVYEATSLIETTNSVIIQASTRVVFNSGSRIHLRPGFRANNTSDFHALIQGCIRGCPEPFPKRNIANDSDGGITWKNDKSKAANSLFIFPNPNNGNFKVKTGLSGVKNITIIDPVGKIIHNADDVAPKQEHEINISHKVASGVYLIRYSTNGIYNTQKLIIH